MTIFKELLFLTPTYCVENLFEFNGALYRAEFRKTDVLEFFQSSFHGSGTDGGLKRGKPVLNCYLFSNIIITTSVSSL